MAQDENGIPVSDSEKAKRRSADLLPRYYRTVANKKFLSSTLDQLTQPGSVEKVDGFIGRKDAKAFKSTDNYVSEVSLDRDEYQLEPVAVINDDVGNNILYRDYRDLYNSLKIRGVDTSNHNNLFTQEYYAWNPNINWDKFTNFREYYWLPGGPEAIPVYGSFREVQSTYRVTKQDNADNDAYVFNQENPTGNPTLTLYKGQTYKFEVDAVDMPFTIRTSVDLSNDNNLYTKGITGQKVEQGTLEFKVDLESPDILYYVNGNDIEGSGLIIIRDIIDNTFLDVDGDIVGKKSYTMSNGKPLSNGMKLKFYGNLSPAKYGTGNWYVEGVGSNISLIPEDELEITAGYLQDQDIEFDQGGFDDLPFDDAVSYANQKDYIVISRGSKDRNQWSRYNKWTHKSVIQTIAEINDVPVNLDQNYRATRPIIEFDAGLKLYDFGTSAKKSVDVIDTVTTDVFSNIEGASGYFVDGTELVQGMRVLFTADPDSFVNGKIYEVKFISQNSNNQITLIETSDTTPITNETVLIRSGTANKGKMYYYNGTVWKQGQNKTAVNQAPLFDLYNDTGMSLSALEGSTFKGNKIFSYKQGTGINDTELGFPLSYRTIENSGDITFDFNLLSETYQYDQVADVITASTDTGILRKYTSIDNFTNVTGWTRSKTNSIQPVVKQYTTGVRNNNFIIDFFENSGDLNDLSVKVYLDNVRQVQDVDYTIDRINKYAYVVFPENLADNKKLVIEATSVANKNQRSHYKFPINFEKNPMNENVTSFTLGEVIDHVDSIVDNINDFEGVYPGVGNLRDLGSISEYGLRFVQHSGPINLALFHLTSKEYDMNKALDLAGKEYIKFKREFLRIANDLGIEGEPKQHVDTILRKVFETHTNKDAYYFSDMVPFGGDTVAQFTIEDQSQTVFPITRAVDFTKLNEKAILVYLDGQQLIKDKEYTIDVDAFVELKIPVKADQVLTVYEYETTDGCWIPPTPTKLGLYPKYEPQIMLDDTYIHTVPDSTGPFKIYGRDETTTKSYKGKVGWFYPVFTDESSAQAYDLGNGGTGVAHTHIFAGDNRIFFMPNSSMSHASHDTQDFDEWPASQPVIQGHDGSIWRCYGDFRDHLILDLEKRIYNNIKIKYDENIVNIKDFVDSKSNPTPYKRYAISAIMISDFNRWLETVGNPDYTTNNKYIAGNNFSINYSKHGSPENTPLPGGWRAIYKDYFNTDRPHSHPWECLGFSEKPSWFDTTYGPAPYTSNNLILWQDLSKGIVREPDKKIIYRNKYKINNLLKNLPVDSGGNLLDPVSSGYARGGVASNYTDDFVFGDEGPVETAWRRSSHYPFSLMRSWMLSQPAQFFGIAFDRSRIARNLAGQLVYTDTSKRINLSNLSFPNIPNDDTRVFTAGLVNYMQAYLKGNDDFTFKKYKNNLVKVENRLGHKIGGFTQKSKFRLILDSRNPKNEGNVFIPEENYNVVLTKSVPLAVYSYSGMIIEKIPSGFLVKGYDKDQPFFNTYSVMRKSNDRLVNVGGVSEDFVSFTSGTRYEIGQIVENSGSFFRVKTGHTTGGSINFEYFTRLEKLPTTGGADAYFTKTFDNTITKVNYGVVYRTVQEVVDLILGYEKYLLSVGFKFDTFNKDLEEIENWTLSAKEFMFWTTQNWAEGAVLTISPSARQVEFERAYTAVDNIYDNFYDYSLLQADGKRLLADFATTERDNTNEFGIYVKNTDQGIYHLKVPVVQTEHAIIIDNTTVFNDVIYNRPQGYRQERIKVKGYRSDEWNGCLNVPGFIFDDAYINEWTAWQDYKIGDIVQYKQYYYVAKGNLTGTSTFNSTGFQLLDKKPEQQLLPNLDYKARQFADFYDLDSDNFDVEQQRLAQHLIGYQKRKYLENIIPDDVSQYKFFQGMIQDKGTKNVLTKLFDKLGSANKDSIEFFEEWAVRVGRYGASTGDEQFELLLNEEKYRLEPQPVELVNEIDPLDTSLVYRLDRNGVGVKPKSYDHKPFPVKYFNDDAMFVKSAGYVNPIDVNLQLKNYTDILTQTIGGLQGGQYVWTATDKSQKTWAVYKYLPTPFKILSTTDSTNNSFTITLNTAPNFAIGDIIGVNDVDDDTNGYYEVQSISLNVVTLKLDDGVDITAVESAKGFCTKFKNVRLKRLSDSNDNIKGEGPRTFSIGSESLSTDRIWVDDDDTGKWLVLDYKQVFELKPNITNTTAGLLDSTQKDFGASVSVTDNNNLIAITAPKDLNGTVYIYNRPSDNVEPKLLQQIDEDSFFFDQNGGFGTSTALSPDGKWLVVGSPEASNTKSALKGDYDVRQSYVKGDVVLYKEQLWQADRIIEAEDVQSCINHASNAQAAENDYITDTQSYPLIPYMMRGNYSMPNDSTDHILIRAETQQWEASKPGDILTLKWNRYTTGALAGQFPFNNDPILNESFINGNHIIVNKVKMVIEVISALDVPDVGDEVTTETARATVAYRYIDSDNKMILYLNNVNGELETSGIVTRNNVRVGSYTTVNHVGDDYHTGWWQISVGSTFNSSNLEETNPNLVIQDFSLAEEGAPAVPSPYTNILDIVVDQQVTEPARNSFYGVLSHFNGATSSNVIDSKWFVRTELNHGGTYQVGDKFRMWANTLYNSGARQDPEPVLNLSFDYLNNTEHTIADIWNGFCIVRLTNFDLNGDPFLPLIGDTVTCSATGSTAEVAYIQREFATIRIYLKNRTGVFAKGVDFGESSNMTFIQNDSTVRTIGPISSSHLENTQAGVMLVVDKGQNIPIGSAIFLQDQEYWIYNTRNIDGVTDSANPPSTINLNWNRVYNLPLSTSGYSSGKENEGTFAVYERKNLTFALKGYYTVPNSDSGRRLGNKIKFAQLGPDTYKLFVHAAGDKTETNEGRIYIFDKNSVDDFVMSNDNNYRGDFNTAATYFENDLVKVGNQIYKAKSNTIPGPFEVNLFEEINSGVDLLGYVPNDTNFSITESTLEQLFLEEFGRDFDVDSTGNVLITTARYLNPEDSSVPNRKVVVYRKVGNHYQYSQLIETDDITENWGQSIAISQDGKKIAVGAPDNSVDTIRGGAVYIYIQNTNGNFVKNQTIRSIDLAANTRFGSKLDFDGNTLAIASKGGDLERVTTLDQATTIFDNGNTAFKVIDNDSGLVSIYETVNDSLLYSQDFAYNQDTQDFGSIMLVKNNHVYLGLPKQQVSTNNIVDRGLVAEYRKPMNKTSWTVSRQPVLPMDVSKFKNIYLYDKTNNGLVQYLDYIDPLQGKIAGNAEQEISFKTSYDPAKYSVSTASGATQDNLDYNATDWVGKIWWDIGSARFINHHQGDILESTANFNTLFEGTSVDVYEWVESDILPSEWDSQTGTEEALADGISGTSKYGDSAYSVRRTFDEASQTFVTAYYFWVKNKATLPNDPYRRVTALDVGRLITDPASQGRRFIAPLGNNRFSLYNCSGLIRDKDIGIAFNWWTIENQEQNTHNEYQIISDGLETSIPNNTIKQKWIDSLVGFDVNDRPVPDIDLPVRQRYGNLNEPRQSWFINRTEARKQFVERVNSVLKNKLIVDTKDLSPLSQVDPSPSNVTGLYDTTSDTYAELKFVSIANVKRASLTLEVENGSIVNVLINDPGRGYINSPTYTIKDTTGSGAVLEFVLDNNGSITSVNIVNAGTNYVAPTISVRRFSVLVKADETVGGKWAVFAWDGTEWFRTLTQAYDVNAYWSYIDWYETGYNQFTSINFNIDNSYQLYGLGDNIGDIVKINNVGSGGWLLLQKEDDQDTEDYTINYKTIGRQNGTIKFLNSLYDVTNKNIAYDGSGFDKIFYDTEPVAEMRLIIDTIENKIFVDDLAIHWNELFFAGLRYVFVEQPNVDWAFKTSFVKAKHNVGELEERITFKNDNLPSYESYINEVKPYRTKVREYLSAYEKIDPSFTSVTDFDLPPVYNELAGKITPQSVQVIDDKIVSGYSEITKYPGKHWADNIGFELERLSIADAGLGYLDAPIVKISGGGGTGAKAVAFIGSNGKVTAVKVTKKGSGYLSRPTITLEGTLEDGGTPARLSPVLGSGKTRATHLRCKFDRVTGTFLFSELSATETFTTTANQQIFNLKWPAQLKNTEITVTVDGLESLRSEYTFENISETTKGYSRKYGRITFTQPLDSGQSVKITYNKSAELLQAQDRINFYYNPGTGMFGNDLGQILDGVDYGGVEVSSYSFGSGTGWDSDSWFTTTYDTFDTTFDDEIFQMDGSTEVFTLSKPLENNVVYNVYLNGKRIDDPNFGTANQTNINAVMASITGDGTSTTITIENTVQRFKANDVVVFRKTTSDGSFLPDPRSYDTVLSGGDLQFSTAKGINPEEIIIDGDGFVTPTTSKGPEEQVPGQVLDTVDIKVFHRPEGGGSLLSSNCFNADGTQTEFNFGIQPQSENGLYVRLNRTIQESNTFTVNYKDKKVKFKTAPTAGTFVNIISVSGNGEKVLELDNFIGDGCTTQFKTKVHWTNNLDYIATVDGKEVESVLVSSEDSGLEDPKAVIVFGQAPRDNSLIHFAVYEETQSFSKIETQEFTGDGSTVNFTLDKTPYSSIPHTHNVIVQVGNKILNAGYNQQFIVAEAQREYFLEIWQTPIGSFDNSNVLATLNGKELKIATEFNIRPANSSIILEPGIGNSGDTLEVYIRNDGEYAFGSIEVIDSQNTWVETPGILKLDVAPTLGEKIKVTTFSKHDIQDFERQNFDVVKRSTLSVGSEDDIQYNHLKAGLIKLRDPAIDAQYVWFIVNGELKTPSVDYFLTDDKQFVKYNGLLADNDVIELIQFSADGPITPKFGFSQFKDILNRNIYKRLGDVAPIKLAKDLLVTDKEISLVDASTISAPDKNSGIPGIVFINGERITFLIKQGNVLKQLQRSTLGTGAPAVHKVGSDVYNQGIQQTAPYADKTIVEDFVGDGSTSVFEMSFTPKSVNEFEVFVAGRRLRKNAIQMFDVTKDQDSPEADITSPAQFSVDGTTNMLTLTTIPAENAKIQVIRRQGVTWTDNGQSLNDAENLVARFFKAEKVELPK